MFLIIFQIAIILNTFCHYIKYKYTYNFQDYKVPELMFVQN